MRVRDRLIVAVIAAVIVVAGMWTLVVSPERNQVSALGGQIASERLSLLTAQQQLSKSRAAADSYVSNVHQIDAVMRAIPPTPQEAKLIRTIVRLAGTKVDFHALNIQGIGAATGAQSLTLSFTFKATYVNLQNFLAAIDALTKTHASGVTANGRLFTISSVSLAPTPPNATTASVSAVVYQQSGPIGPPAGATGATAAATTSAVSP
jgi:Tfp pilus assembly protein PilO